MPADSPLGGRRRGRQGTDDELIAYGHVAIDDGMRRRERRDDLDRRSFPELGTEPATEDPCVREVSDGLFGRAGRLARRLNE